MSRYKLWPIAMIDGQCSVPDEVLIGIWQRLVQEKKAKHLFYGGAVKNEYEFMEFIKHPSNFPVLVVDEKTNEIVHLAWLNGLCDTYAFAHHAAIGTWHRGATTLIIDYWKELFGPQGLTVLLGLTPASNEKAIKFLKLMGFKPLSPAIPNLCNMLYDGTRTGAVISYLELQ